MSITYKDSGVDIVEGEKLVDKIKQKVGKTYGERVCDGVGGFASLYRSGDRLLAAGTDGVGTKLEWAKLLGKHDTIGIDLVAMCANDIICTGAKPLFFLDYFACGSLKSIDSEAVIDGIVDGCLQSGMALIGGETAEMPGMYPEGEYDLAGFAVGEVFENNLISGSKIKAGDKIIGLASSGFHSNGHSLLRKIVPRDNKALMELVLTPTKIYVSLINKLIGTNSNSIHGLAHITGGGMDNVGRLNKKVNYHLTNLPTMNQIAPVYSEVLSMVDIDRKELYRTFNMGVGFMIITDDADGVCNQLKELGERHWVIGEVTSGDGQVIF